jgi:hypothetical protein
MAAGLPLLKLSALLVKTISKPVGMFFKAQAQKEPRVAKLFMDVGQRMHYVQSRINVVASGYKFVGVKPLPNDQALNDGAGTMSELLVLSLSATIVIYEYQKSAIKDRDKANALNAEKQTQRFLTEQRFKDIESRLQHIEALLEKNVHNQQTQNQQLIAGSQGSGSLWSRIWGSPKQKQQPDAEKETEVAHQLKDVNAAVALAGSGAGSGSGAGAGAGTVVGQVELPPSETP